MWAIAGSGRGCGGWPWRAARSSNVAIAVAWTASTSSSRIGRSSGITSKTRIDGR